MKKYFACVAACVLWMSVEVFTSNYALSRVIVNVTPKELSNISEAREACGKKSNRILMPLHRLDLREHAFHVLNALRK